MKLGLWKLTVVAVSLVFSAVLIAQEQSAGEVVYKSKCAGCHSVAGEKKAGAALKGSKMSEEDIVRMLSKGIAAKRAPHTRAMSSLKDDQVTAVAHYVKNLK